MPISQYHSMLKLPRLASRLVRPALLPSFTLTRISPTLTTKTFTTTTPIMSQAENQAEAPAAQTPKAADPEPMSAEDFAFFNKLAVQMDLYHNHFRQSWDIMWKACEAGRRPMNMKLPAFLRHAEQFLHHLEMHHGIEEQILYPRLADRLPHFHPRNGALVAQHREIHDGMDGLQRYVDDCRSGAEDFSMAGLRAKLEPWGAVLWTHLDEEVAALGAVHMKKAFTKDEFRRIQM
jgi:hemerythrin-like domain-containing protein